MLSALQSDQPAMEGLYSLAIQSKGVAHLFCDVRNLDALMRLLDHYPCEKKRLQV